jgi:hypothetical protein
MAEITIKLTQGKLLFIVAGVLLSAGLSLHQYFLFLRAYFSKSKAVVLFIDKMGEANLELILMTISAIIIVITTYYIMKFLSNLKKGGGKVCLV